MGSRSESSAQDRLICRVVEQHERVRSLFRAAAHSGAEGREDACARLLWYLALHVAAERLALSPPGAVTPPELVRRRVRAEAALDEAVERLLDLGANCGSSRVQLALLAAEVHRHVSAGETEELPQLVAAARDDEELRRAVEVLERVPLVERGEDREAFSVPIPSFRHQLARARTLLAGAPAP